MKIWHWEGKERVEKDRGYKFNHLPEHFLIYEFTHSS